MNLTRHEIREKALQALFPLDFNADLSKEDAIKQALEFEHEEWINQENTEFVPIYLDVLVTGVCDHQDEIDEIIQKYLIKWTVSRIAKTDLIILRLAVYEMLYLDDIPAKVALNEALELTKKYSDDESRKFVNGVLSQLLAEEQV